MAKSKPHNNNQRHGKGSSGEVTIGGNRIQKKNSQKHSRPIKSGKSKIRNELKEFLNGSGKTQRTANSSKSSSPSNESTTDSLDDMDNMLADAAAPEPADDQTPQVMNDGDRLLTRLVPAASTRSEDIQKVEQFFRRIYILYDGDPDNQRARTRRALLDTGSRHSLVFERTLEDLEIRYQPFKEVLLLTSVQQRKFKAIGHRQILFKYRGRDATHTADFLVLKNPRKGLNPSFDVLLGRDHLIPTDAVQINKAIVGDTYHVSDQTQGHG